MVSNLHGQLEMLQAQATHELNDSALSAVQLFHQFRKLKNFNREEPYFKSSDEALISLSLLHYLLQDITRTQEGCF